MGQPSTHEEHSSSASEAARGSLELEQGGGSGSQERKGGRGFLRVPARGGRASGRRQ